MRGKHSLTDEILSNMLASVPNKRKPGKKFIGGYMSQAVKRQFQKAARQEAGGDQRKFLLTLIREGLQRRGIDIPDENEPERK